MVAEVIEVRLLGALRVRRADGTYVGAGEWRTAMTRGVLALVALRAPNPVPVDVVLETIWPGVPADRSRARLRTAASQIRKVVGSNCIAREGDALVLRGAWVDTEAFKAAAAQVRRHLAGGDVDTALAVANEATGLYAGDVCGDWPYTDWIDGPRAQLATIHQHLLEDLAEVLQDRAAWAEAITLADRAAQIDPCSERACRVLMRANHAIGESATALLAYERCRTALVESVGADPSEQTESLHRTLLRRLDLHPPVPFVGRAEPLTWLAQQAVRAFTTRTPVLLHVAGAAGSGKSRLLDELDVRLGVHAVLVRLQSAHGRDAAAAFDQIVRHVEDSPDGPGANLAVRRPTLVCVDDAGWAHPDGLHRLADALREVQAPLAVVVAGADPAVAAATGPVRRLGALARDEVARLAVSLVPQGVTAEVVDALIDASGGLPGPVVEEVVRRAAVGAFVAGPTATPGTPTPPGEVLAHPEHVLASARDRLDPGGLAVLDLLAVVGMPIEVADLQRLAEEPGAVPAALDVLDDAGVIRRHERGWALADPALHEAALSWLRPSVRRALHLQVATDEDLPMARDARLGHWLAAGTPARALPRPADAPGLADALRLLPADVAAATAALEGEVERADAAVDPHARVAARHPLVLALLAGRRWIDAADAARAAADIADAAGDPDDRGLALHAIACPALWGGHPMAALHLLERAWAVSTPDSPSLPRILRGMARALGALGLPDADHAAELAHRMADPDDSPAWHLLAAELALDADDAAGAVQHLAQAGPPDPAAPAVARVWRLVLAGRAEAAVGLAAAGSLQQAVDLARVTGAVLHLPEAIARLAAVVAPTDHDHARGLLLQAHRAATGHHSPRERAVLLVAQAQVLLAAGEREGALGLARAAAAIAGRAGLANRVAEADATMAAARRRTRTHAA